MTAYDLLHLLGPEPHNHSHLIDAALHQIGDLPLHEGLTSDLEHAFRNLRYQRE